MFGFGAGIVGQVGGAPTLAARVAAMFRNGEQAVWFDPSDLSALYQDAAGTTPVTAMEQPVGLMLDKSGRGNHCTFKAGTGRPVLSARYNLCSNSQANTGWAGAGTTPPTVQNSIAHLGESCASIKFASGNALGFAGTRAATSHTVAPIIAGRAYITSIELALSRPLVGSESFAFYFTGANGLGLITVTKNNSDADGFFRVTPMEQTVSVSGNDYPCVFLVNAVSSDLTVYVKCADLRASNDGIGLPAYQRVVDSATYDTAGFPVYLRADGTDDGGSTNSIDFTGTDKITVFAGVRKLSDAAASVLAELSASVLSNNGSFYALAPSVNGLPNFGLASKGSSAVGISSPNNFAAPSTNVISGIGNISGDQTILRVSGAQAASSTADQGTGNYGNYPLFLFARNNASLYFNGRLYGLIVLGRAATATEIVNTERYLNMKAKVY